MPSRPEIITGCCATPQRPAGRGATLAHRTRKLSLFEIFGPEPKATWLFRRGNYYDRDLPVQLGFLQVLTNGRSPTPIGPRRKSAERGPGKHESTASPGGLDHRRRPGSRAPRGPGHRQPDLAASFRGGVGADRRRFWSPIRSAEPSPKNLSSGWPKTWSSMAGGSSTCTE